MTETKKRTAKRVPRKRTARPVPTETPVEEEKKTTGTTKCGWCLTDHHHMCKPSVSWYGKTWYCSCTCPKESNQ